MADFHFDFNFIYCLNVPTLSPSPSAPTLACNFANSSPILLRIQMARELIPHHFFLFPSIEHKWYLWQWLANFYGISSASYSRPGNATQHQTNEKQNTTYTVHTLWLNIYYQYWYGYNASIGAMRAFGVLGMRWKHVPFIIHACITIFRYTLRHYSGRAQGKVNASRMICELFIYASATMTIRTADGWSQRKRLFTYSVAFANT